MSGKLWVEKPLRQCGIECALLLTPGFHSEEIQRKCKTMLKQVKTKQSL